MTVCPKCNGRGTVGYFHIDHFVDIECDRCHGSGEVQMTNEEWIKSLDTEQLAEFLYDIAYFDNWSDAIMNDSLINETAVEDAIEKWLKQPHHEKE